MNKFVIAGVVSVSIGLSGCATNGNLSNNQATGLLAGCLGGAGIGAAVAKSGWTGLLIGCVAGAAAGYGIASMLDEHEKQELAEARMRAFESNERVDWGQTGSQPSQPPQPQEQPKTQEARWDGPYSKHHGHYCEKHRSYCERRDKTEEAKIAKTEKSKPDASHSKPTSATQVASATGWMIPVRTYTDASGQTCRELKEQVTKNDQTKQDTITGCKASTGWVIQSA